VKGSNSSFVIAIENGTSKGNASVALN